MAKSITSVLVRKSRSEIEKALESGAEVDQLDPEGRSALLLAAIDGRTDGLAAPAVAVGPAVPPVVPPTLAR